MLEWLGAIALTTIGGIIVGAIRVWTLPWRDKGGNWFVLSWILAVSVATFVLIAAFVLVTTGTLRPRDLLGDLYLTALIGPFSGTFMAWTELKWRS